MNKLEISRKHATDLFQTLNKDYVNLAEQVLKNHVKNLALVKKHGWVLFTNKEIESLASDKDMFFRYLDTFLVMKEKERCFKVSKINDMTDSGKYSYVFSQIDLGKIENHISNLTALENSQLFGSEAKLPGENPYVTKKEGNFYYGNELLSLEEDSMYKDLFSILYETPGGIIKYDAADKKLIDMGYKKVPPKKVSKRIQNLINNGIFNSDRLDKDNQKFRNKLPDGRKLIKIIRKRGIQFNNYPL